MPAIPDTYKAWRTSWRCPIDGKAWYGGECCHSHGDVERWFADRAAAAEATEPRTRKAKNLRLGDTLADGRVVRGTRMRDNGTVAIYGMGGTLLVRFVDPDERIELAPKAAGS